MEDVRPTARWGYRMLRPLKSIYHRLEKYRLSQSLVDASQNPNETTEIPGAQVTVLNRKLDRGDIGSGSESDREDPSWIPGKTDKRRIKHKYSARGEGNGRRRLRSVLRSPETQRKLPGAIEIGTPLITGRLPDRSSNVEPTSHETVSQQSGQSGSKNRGRRSKSKDLNYPVQNSIWQSALNRSGDPNFSQIVQQLNRVFFTFLAGTRVPDSYQRGARGARSLLSMAARRLPEFISQEQRLQDELDEDEDVDMADAYFTELEALYAPSGTGWQPLREAVRAQGIHLVSEVIQKNWLADSATYRLLEECVEQHEFDALEILLSNKLSTLSESPAGPSGLVVSHVSLELLRKYYRVRQNPYVFDELANVLVRSVVPPRCLVVMDWDKVMNDAIESLSKMDDNFAAATRLIEAVILSASGIRSTKDASEHSTHSSSLNTGPRETRASTEDKAKPSADISTQDAISNLVLSFVIALCGMHIVRSNDSSTDGSSTNTVMQDILKRLAFMVQREVELRPLSGGNELPTWTSLRRGSVLLGNYLLQCGNPHSLTNLGESDPVVTHNLEHFFRSLAGQQEIVKELSVLARQVIRCCERAINQHELYMDYVDNVFTRFIEAGVERTLSLFLGKVVVEVAMDFAQTSQDPEDHARAADLQEKLAQCHTHIQWGGPEVRSRMPYRWEESIGEWVESTPFPKIRNSQSVALLKPLVLIPNHKHASIQMPSSSASPSSQSEDCVTSVTSSSPPLSLKRPLEDSDLPRREKRARRIPFVPSRRLINPQASHNDDINIDVDDDGDEPSVRGPPNCDGGCDLDSPSKVLNVRRRILREVPTADHLDTPVTGNPETTINPSIEVVIVNKQDVAAAEDNFLNVREPLNRRGRGRPRRQELHRSYGAGKRMARPPSPPRKSLVISCSEDDESEDELCFL